MSLERFCWKHVVTVREYDNAATVAQQMRDEHVGAVVVVDDEQIPLGLITDRDLVCRVTADGKDPNAIRAGEVMTAPVVVMKRSETIDAAFARMRASGCRRLPIVESNQKVCGMVSLDDLTVLLSGELSSAADVVRADRGP